MADEIKSIVSKVSEGLNFFDFSFFVSGFLTFMIVEYVVNVLNYRYLYYSSFVDYLLAIVFIYIAGIISFVAGRFLRTMLRNRFEVSEKPSKWYQVASFNYIYQNTFSLLEVKIPEGVFQSDPSLAYTQMWIEIRKEDTDGKCYGDLYRQWVMLAVCEGLLFSFLLSMSSAVFLMVYEWLAFDSTSMLAIYALAFVGSIIGMLVCLREAQRYAENQIKEVIISYLLLKKKLPTA